MYSAECDVPVPGIPGTGNFHFFWWYRNRYRKNLVPEKSIGTGIGKIWYRKKYRNWYRKKINIKKGFVFLSNLVILIFLHRIFFLNPITKCKFLFIIMKFFSKAKLDDDNIQYLVQKNHSHPYQKFTFTFLADFSIPHIWISGWGWLFFIFWYQHQDHSVCRVLIY